MTKTKHHRICYSFESILHKINRFSILTGTIRVPLRLRIDIFNSSCFVDLLSADAYAFTHMEHRYTEFFQSREMNKFICNFAYVYCANIENHFSTRISVRVCPLREMRKWKMKGKMKISFLLWLKGNVLCEIIHFLMSFQFF